MTEEKEEEEYYLDVETFLTSLDARFGYYARTYKLSVLESQIKVLDDVGILNQDIAGMLGKPIQAINDARSNANKKLPFNERTKGKRASKK